MGINNQNLDLENDENNFGNLLKNISSGLSSSIKELLNLKNGLSNKDKLSFFDEIKDLKNRIKQEKQKYHNNSIKIIKLIEFEIFGLTYNFEDIQEELIKIINEDIIFFISSNNIQSDEYINKILNILNNLSEEAIYFLYLYFSLPCSGKKYIYKINNKELKIGLLVDCLEQQLSK